MKRYSIAAAACAAALLFSAGGAAGAEAKWTLAAASTYTQRVTIAGFLDANNGITAGYAGAVYHSGDGGKTWSRGNNSSWCRFGLEILDGQNAWTSGNKGHVRVSRDGGATWTAAADFGDMEPAQCRYLSFADASTGWIASGKRLAATVDGAATWTELALPEGMDAISAIHLQARDRGFVLTADGALHDTRDGGKTWKRAALNLNGKKLQSPVTIAPTAALRFRDEKQGTLVFLTGGDAPRWVVMRTTDGGKSWKEETLPAQVAAIGRGVVFLSRDASLASINDESNKTVYVLRRL